MMLSIYLDKRMQDKVYANQWAEREKCGVIKP